MTRELIEQFSCQGARLHFFFKIKNAASVCLNTDLLVVEIHETNVCEQ